MGNMGETMEKTLLESVAEYFSEEGWPRLSSRSFLVWAALLSRAVVAVNIASVSYRELMGMTGIGSKATVSRSILELLDKGYISRIPVPRSGSAPDLYRLLLVSRRGGGSIDEARIRMVMDMMLGEAVADDGL